MTMLEFAIFFFFKQSAVAAYWEIAAHWAYNMFSQYKYLGVNLVFFPPRFF